MIQRNTCIVDQNHAAKSEGELKHHVCLKPVRDQELEEWSQMQVSWTLHIQHLICREGGRSASEDEALEREGIWAKASKL